MRNSDNLCLHRAICPRVCRLRIRQWFPEKADWLRGGCEFGYSNRVTRCCTQFLSCHEARLAAYLFVIATFSSSAAAEKQAAAQDEQDKPRGLSRHNHCRAPLSI
jgi:hypothetical protein